MSRAYDNAADARFQQGGRRNLIINGAMQVAQRGTSFSSDGYTLDRWSMSLSGSTGSVSQQTFTAGQIDVPNEPINYLRFNISSYVGEFNIFQRIEDVRSLAGQTATLSFYMKADSSVTVSPFMVQNFGSGGSSNVNNALSTVSVTTSWQKFEVSFSVPSISGKTIGSSSYLQIMPLRVTSSFTGNIDIANVQLELGNVATSFEHRSYGEELALCQRYYFRFAVNDQLHAQPMWAFSTNNASTRFYFPTTMRSAPSITIEGSTTTGDDWDVYYDGAYRTPTNINVANPIPESFRLNVTTTSGLVSGGACGFYSRSLDAGLTADAEL